MRLPLSLHAIGCTAHDALLASAGMLEMLTDFDLTGYARANGDLIWIGHGEIVMHPRVVVLQQPTRVTIGDRLDAGALTPWHPPSLAMRAVPDLRAGCVALAGKLARVPRLQGFAVMLAGGVPAFPFECATPRVHALASAFDADDPAAVYEKALPLLGLGPGLTPAGDDLVGAALFARRTMAGSAGDTDAWSRVAMRLIDAANANSHPMAAALFRDLASVGSFAPLHRLAASLAVGACDDDAVDAARTLVAIGHSSGWEMLAGFIIGATGSLIPSQRRDTR